jgi:phosphatidylserine/phosphatidylglycerophosphate/cardiolipin synthase-like enzyme
MKKITVPEMVVRFIEDLPNEYINRAAIFLQKETQLDFARITHRLQSAIPKTEAQEKVRAFVEDWSKVDNAPAPAEMSLLITAVALALDHQRQKQSIELTWTGPKTENANLRRTDQALIELINSARKRITIVSFAVYKAKSILSALEKAARREVEINIIIESPDASEGKIAHDTIKGLGSALKSMAKIHIWPYAKREVTPNGKHGSLHAKVAVSDQKTLYISSANLTDYAMNLNMEMGILLTGGELPAQAQNHFDELIAEGTLSELSFE